MSAWSGRIGTIDLWTRRQKIPRLGVVFEMASRHQKDIETLSPH
jgi:hypothetical protein